MMVDGSDGHYEASPHSMSNRHGRHAIGTAFRRVRAEFDLQPLKATATRHRIRLNVGEVTVSVVVFLSYGFDS
jgi:hypothetical protein